ncbi:hypothetical protein EGW08_000904 [Elysia chlorotica]|uniref:Uncharacterized protein n=1 Tax=Elysia chlorotica TaxID=188477 RepID=A0A3S1BU04_ELYCH|nr:hypothetical protein EGW08_000904 [Elysia chlorotica]
MPSKQRPQAAGTSPAAETSTNKETKAGQRDPGSLTSCSSKPGSSRKGPAPPLPTSQHVTAEETVSASSPTRASAHPVPLARSKFRGRGFLGRDGSKRGPAPPLPTSQHVTAEETVSPCSPTRASAHPVPLARSKFRGRGFLGRDGSKRGDRSNSLVIGRYPKIQTILATVPNSHFHPPTPSHRPLPRRSLHDTRVKSGTDAASDRHLVVAVLKTKIKAFYDKARRTVYKFNVQCLRELQKSEHFKSS